MTTTTTDEQLAASLRRIAVTLGEIGETLWNREETLAWRFGSTLIAAAAELNATLQEEMGNQ